jgi:hypothetical protein
MSQRVISIETLRQERRRSTVKETIEFNFGGKPHTITKEIVNGEMVTYDFSAPLGEMMTTPQGLLDVVQKSIIDLELGREQVPLLYQPIYRRIEDRNFTENVDVAPFIGAQVVFLEHLELGEVKMGTRKIGPKETVPLLTYTAGFEWTEDIVMYDKTWEVQQLNQAMGEAYNALLNHIHLYPIISYNYAAKNKTAAVTLMDDGSTPYTTHRERVRATIRKALIHASQDKDQDTNAPRRPSILLAHSSRRWDIQDALGRFTVGGTEYAPLDGIDTLIFYDGHTIQVGGETYDFAGCDPNKAYLIEPQRYYRELVKHDLLVDAAPGDLKRLVEQVMVGRARRGVIASPAKSVEEITLPS